MHQSSIVITSCGALSRDVYSKNNGDNIIMVLAVLTFEFLALIDLTV